MTPSSTAALASGIVLMGLTGALAGLWWAWWQVRRN